MQVGLAVSLMFPVTIAMRTAGELVIARAKNTPTTQRLTGIQVRDSHEWLNSGTGWILPMQDSVKQRPLGIEIETFVGLAVDTIDEKIGIKAGCTDHGQYFAGCRGNRHHRTIEILQCLLRLLLQ